MTTNLEKPIEIGKQPAVYLTVEEHYDLMCKAVQSVLTNLTLAKPADTTPKVKYLNYTQAYKYLQVSKPTFGLLRKEEKIKGIQVSPRRVLFSQDDLDAYLLSKHE
jgi:hypothetical protein